MSSSSDTNVFIKPDDLFIFSTETNVVSAGNSPFVSLKLNETDSAGMENVIMSFGGNNYGVVRFSRPVPPTGQYILPPRIGIVPTESKLINIKLINAMNQLKISEIQFQGK